MIATVQTNQPILRPQFNRVLDPLLCTLSCCPAMLRITRLSGETLASIPAAEVDDVKALKQRLHQHYDLPPRFRQRLFHEGKSLDDSVSLDSVKESHGAFKRRRLRRKTLDDSIKPDVMELQVLITAFVDASEDQTRKLRLAAGSSRVAEAGQFGTDNKSSRHLH